MKRFIFACLCVLCLLPFSSFAGNPNRCEQSESFCSCFTEKAKVNCLAHQPPSMCDPQKIHQGITVLAVRMGLKKFCDRYLYMLPKDVNGDECAEDLAYYNKMQCS